MQHLKIYNKQHILDVTKICCFETKIGERLQTVSNPLNIASSIKQLSAKFVLFGVPEAIGVKANHRTGGTETAWLSFLQLFSNIKSNDFLCGNEILYGKPAYLHICEGATPLSTAKQDASTGKLISYLVSNFVKGILQQSA
jgi:hypothetical protein